MRCEACPETGGDTMWANMVLAYEMLPDRIKARIEGLYARHSAEHIFAAQLPIQKRHEAAARLPSIDHPVVRLHPETGEKVMFVNQDQSYEEARRLLPADTFRKLTPEVMPPFLAVEASVANAVDAVDTALRNDPAVYKITSVKCA